MVKKLRTLRGIGSSVQVSKRKIDHRMQRGILVARQNNGGPYSPMAPCDDYFVDIIIKLSQCRHSISSSDCLQLMNSLIK